MKNNNNKMKKNKKNNKTRKKNKRKKEKNNNNNKKTEKQKENKNKEKKKNNSKDKKSPLFTWCFLSDCSESSTAQWFSEATRSSRYEEFVSAYNFSRAVSTSYRYKRTRLNFL